MQASRDVENAHRRTLEIEAGRGDRPPAGDEETRGARLVVSMRLIKGENVVNNHTLVALSLGLVPLPLFDVAVLTSNQVSMVRALGAIYGQTFSSNKAKAVVFSLLGGSAPVLGVLGLSAGVKWIPGIGTLAGSSGVAVSGGALTYAVGRLFLSHFESGGTLLTFDAAKAYAQFRQEIRRGRRVVADLRAQGAAGPTAARYTESA